jgi:hypothetical protein
MPVTTAPAGSGSINVNVAGAQEPTVVCSAGMVTVAVPGAMITKAGFSLSVTVTVKVLLDTPAALVAVAVTVVIPIGKILPGACE